jgi:hypothetical protein
LLKSFHPSSRPIAFLSADKGDTEKKNRVHCLGMACGRGFGVCGFGVCGFGVCGFGVCGFGVCGFGVCGFGARGLDRG